MKRTLQEAATIKARVQRISREMAGLLSDKTLPDSLRKQVESFQAALKKTWAELESEAGQERGHKGVAAQKAKEDGGTLPPSDSELEEYYDADGEYVFVPVNIISFADLDTAQAAREIAENMRERVAQFQQMLNNIFFWSSEEAVPDKIGAATTLFDEFIDVVGQVLAGEEEPDAITGGAGGPGRAQSEAGGAGEAANLSESYEPVVTLVEAESSSPRGPLEMDVQLIQPGWGNSRDNHYYPADMLKRDAKVFEGAKMYTTDHRTDEKSVRTEVSQIKAITGFSEAGAPIARVAVFDPDFAEQARNRAAAGVLSSLECSILADGRARPGFERDGRKGKIVEAITSVSSVDWVTRAGAGGKALSLAESAADPEKDQPPDEPAPVTEADPAQPVSIREQEGEGSADAPSEDPHAEEPAAADQAGEPASDPAELEPEDPPSGTAESEPETLGEAEVDHALAATHLPAASVVQLMRGRYETAEDLARAIAAEVKRIKEISGSGRPFGMGESSAAQPVQPPRSKIEETIDKVNSKYLGR